jgi:hypothetical protein
MPSLLNELTKPGCIRPGNQWGHCGVYYVEPTGAAADEARIGPRITSSRCGRKCGSFE